MEYTDFVKAMHREVRGQMEPDVAVEIHTAIKNNSALRTGLVFIKKDVNIAPTIYLEEFYEQYLEGASVQEMAQTIHSIYEKISLKNSYPYNNILKFENIKDKIVYKLIHKESNLELLREIPYEEYLDLAVVFYILLDHTGFGPATILIRSEHMLRWNVTKEEISRLAKENTPKLLPMDLGILADTMYVVTNQTRNLGAAVMLYPDTWEKVAALIGEDFYILPSSIHELIVVPESIGMNRLQLENMVEEINHTEVEQEEILSNTVYRYIRKEKRVIF